MRSVIASAAIAAFVTLFACVSSLVAADCSSVPAATTIWKPTCTNLTSLGEDSCWTNGVPNANSSVLFPAGTNASMGTWVNITNGTGIPYVIFRAAYVVIDAGAVVNMTGDGMEIGSCLQVKGTLRLDPGDVAGPIVQPPMGAYRPDPSQPYNTDCALVAIGFTPRVCGPGKIEVSGTVELANYYSSLFISGTVLPSGALYFHTNSFFWGNLSNQGSYITGGYSYQHGFLWNSGVASLGTVAFDKWATTFVSNVDHPLLIENSGNLTFTGSAAYPTNAYYTQEDAGTYRAAVVNRGHLVITAWLAPWGFDLYNLGTTKWTMGDNGWSFEGDGTYVNRGTMIADGTDVQLGHFVDEGGVMYSVNGGSFSFDSGMANVASRATMRLCSLVQNMPSNLQTRYRENARRRAAAIRHLRAPGPVVVIKDGCNWYCDFCYQMPYWAAEAVDDSVTNNKILKDVEHMDPVDPTGLPIHRHNGAVRLHIQRVLADDIVPAEPCHPNRFRFTNTTIRGDGKGSIVSTVPIQLAGEITVAAGGKWHMVTERGAAPVFGGGKLVIKRGGAVFAGVEADFKHDGTLEVQRGAILAVPRHANVRFTNHTIVVRPGATLHVDGKLAFAERAGARLRIDHCGVVDGIGDLTVDHANALSCSQEPANPARRMKRH